MTKIREATWLQFALVAILLVGLAACMSTVSKHQQISDAELTAAVKTRLTANPDVAARNIDVDTLEGVVTLSGRVASMKEKQEAEEVTRNTQGVKKCVNRLEVGDRG